MGDIRRSYNIFQLQFQLSRNVVHQCCTQSHTITYHWPALWLDLHFNWHDRQLAFSQYFKWVIFSDLSLRTYRTNYISGPKHCCYETSIGIKSSFNNDISEELAATAAHCQKVNYSKDIQIWLLRVREGLFVETFHSWWIHHNLLPLIK